MSVIHSNSMYIFGGSAGTALNDLHELQLPPNVSTPAKWYVFKATMEQPLVYHGPRR
jgi:hypothetical protein